MYSKVKESVKKLQGFLYYLLIMSTVIFCSNSNNQQNLGLRTKNRDLAFENRFRTPPHCLKIPQNVAFEF